MHNMLEATTIPRRASRKGVTYRAIGAVAILAANLYLGHLATNEQWKIIVLDNYCRRGKPQARTTFGCGRRVTIWSRWNF